MPPAGKDISQLRPNVAQACVLKHVPVRNDCTHARTEN